MFKAPHKSLQSPLGNAVPVNPVRGHWSFKGKRGKKKKSDLQPSVVTITPGNGGFVVRRASADKTVMATAETYQKAEQAAFNMGYRVQKVGKSTRELSLGD